MSTQTNPDRAPVASSFDDRVVIVTGGAGAIGSACLAQVLAQGGHPVSVDIAEPIETANSTQVLALRADVRAPSEVTAAVDVVLQRYGRIDVLVNNAATVRFSDIVTDDLADWTSLWEVNVLGYARMIQAALPGLYHSAAPAIVNMSSFTATAGFRRRAAYAATKGAIESLTRSLAVDLLQDGITVNAISPGTVDSPLLNELARRSPDPDTAMSAFAERQPTGRMVTAAEVSRAVAFLADPVNRSTTGTVIAIDGGIGSLRLTAAP